jgi:hypothetical protein
MEKRSASRNQKVVDDLKDVYLECFDQIFEGGVATQLLGNAFVPTGIWNVSNFI